MTNRLDIVMFVIVIAMVLVVGYSVFTAFDAQMHEGFENYCEDEYGEQWELNNDSEQLQCVHTNGTQREITVNLTGNIESGNNFTITTTLLN